MPSGCWRCTAVAGRPTLSMPIVRPGRRLSTRSGLSRALSCVGCTRRSCARTALGAARVAPRELPPELYAGTPLVGRESDLDWLREQWRRAHAGAGRLLLVAGPRGIGKTRLAAEIAAEVQRDGVAVLYASGAGVPAAACAALESAGAARRPTLLVLDDLDRAGDEPRAALAELVDGLSARPVLVLAVAEEASLAAGVRADGTLVLRWMPKAWRPWRGSTASEGAERRSTTRARVVAFRSGSTGAAAEWARTETARHLEAAASRAASERAGLRVAEDELAGNVMELQAAARSRKARGRRRGRRAWSARSRAWRRST